MAVSKWYYLDESIDRKCSPIDITEAHDDSYLLSRAVDDDDSFNTTNY